MMTNNKFQINLLFFKRIKTDELQRESICKRLSLNSITNIEKNFMMCECSRSQRVGWKVDKVT